MLEYHRDMSNLDAMKLYKKAENLLTECSEIVSFVSPELSELSEDRLKGLVQEERFNPYAREIEDIIKQKKHILSKDIEEVEKCITIFLNKNRQLSELRERIEFVLGYVEEKDETK